MNVSSLLFRALASGRGVWLPQVGSLVLESKGAWQSSPKRLEAPSRRIVFREGEHGTSLVDLIGTPSSEETYTNWLAGVRTGDDLSIPGVGELKQRRFTPHPDLDTALNPLGHDPLILKPRTSKVTVSLLLALLLVAAAGYGTWWLKESGKWKVVSDKWEEISAELKVKSEKSESEELTDIVIPDVQRTEESTAVIEPQDTIQHSTFNTEHSIPGRTYVVLGVYSTEENARRAVAESDCSDNAHLYYYGDKWMVSIFESDSQAAARTFIADLDNAPKGLWPYTKR